MNGNEPILVRMIVTVVIAVLGLLVAFNVPITEVQQNAIVTAITAIALLILFLWSRPAVTPNAKVAAQENARGVIVAGPASAAPNGTPVTVESTGYGRRVDLDPPAEDPPSQRGTL
jgi:hypothetical protein